MMRRYAEILRTPGMPNPDPAEREKWNAREYKYSSELDLEVVIRLPVVRFEFTDQGKALTVTVNGESSVKHRSHPMTPQEQESAIAQLKTQGTVFWDGSEL